MNLIAAVDENWGLGRQDRLLFHLSPDLKHFKELTLGGVLVMGRRTLESLPGARPLQGRINIVLSRTLAEQPGQLLVCRDLSRLKERLASLGRTAAAEDVWVIGGAQVYRQLLPFCRRAYITRVAASRPADVFLPDLEQEAGWYLAEMGQKQQWEGLSFRFDRFENRAPAEL